MVVKGPRLGGDERCVVDVFQVNEQMPPICPYKKIKCYQQMYILKVDASEANSLVSEPASGRTY